jgi:hypothetical protein
MNFASGVSSTNDEDIDVLMGNKTPGADNLLGAKEETKEEASVKTESKKLPEKVEAPASEEEEADLLLGGDEEESEEEAPKEKKLPKQEPKTQQKKTQINQDMEVDYEAIYQNMVENGIWEEVEVPEGTEWDKETFLEVQKLQAESKYEDLLSKTGSYGKAIIEFEQNGGNPSELLSLFREQRDVRDFDITSSDGQEEFLSAYLQTQGYSEKSIDRTIRSLKDQGGSVLQEEAEEKKGLWDQQYKEEIKARQQEQALYSQEVQKAQKQFHETMVSTITKDGDLTLKERRELQGYILSYDQNFKGQNVSQFYVDMTEIQKDPKNYIELAKFIKGLKTGEYTKKVADKVQKETSAKSFLKIKNGAALKSSSGNPDLDRGTGSNFVSLLSKK